jgi:predicted DNA-binding protein (MmcQ/YjbR family)
MTGLERIVSRLPEAERVDIVEWGDHPTFRVRGKNFIFCDADAVHLSVKLPAAEAEAVVATDPRVEPAGYGLGRHGWIAITLSSMPDRREWRELEDWVRTSYTFVAPRLSQRSCLKRTHVRRRERRGGVRTPPRKGVAP